MQKDDPADLAFRTPVGRADGVFKVEGFTSYSFYVLYLYLLFYLFFWSDFPASRLFASRRMILWKYLSGSWADAIWRFKR